ncbi:hypothetical protein SAMN05444358_1011223 [Ruegeria halocynthiae]|uniref:Uncharacterized protein n=1 Tax=Ruegeria halocynthiae TaxID=985054 RepID=A0A1H2URM2_9RHOB|nr:hypothetical protein [Ruegeria halocynthiae]SDW58628.1 hypothetical protein SAMN05444358_1011223 [Ruegeria halocynthiae]
MNPEIVAEANYDSGIRRQDFNVQVPGVYSSKLWRGYNGITQLSRVKYIHLQLAKMYQLSEQRKAATDLYEKHKEQPSAELLLMAGFFDPKDFSCDLDRLIKGDRSVNRNLTLGFAEHNFISSNLISSIRRFLDVHLQILCVEKLGGRKENGSLSIKYDSVGALLNPKVTKPEAHTARRYMWGSENLAGKSFEFIRLVDTLSNCMKHHFMQEQAMNLFSVDEPSIVAFEARNKDPRKVIYHNHFAWQIVAGFQQLVDQLAKSFEADFSHAS